VGLDGAARPDLETAVAASGGVNSITLRPSSRWAIQHEPPTPPAARGAAGQRCLRGEPRHLRLFIGRAAGKLIEGPPVEKARLLMGYARMGRQATGPRVDRVIVLMQRRGPEIVFDTNPG